MSSEKEVRMTEIATAVLIKQEIAKNNAQGRQAYAGFLQAELAAARLRSVSRDLMPGQLQTPKYAETLAAIHGWDIAHAQMRQVRRADMLRRTRAGLLSARFIVGTSVLRPRNMPADVMTEQLRQLSELSKEQNISIRFIEPSSTTFVGHDEFMYTLMDADQSQTTPRIYAEAGIGDAVVDYLADDTLTGSYEEAWQQTEAHAYDERATRQILQAMLPFPSD